MSKLEFFRALPPQVDFRDVERGKTYKASLQLQNTSAIAKRVSITEPKNGVFRMKVNNGGTSDVFMIAAGMVYRSP
jgi:hypothetical protein